MVTMTKGQQKLILLEARTQPKRLEEYLSKDKVERGNNGNGSQGNSVGTKANIPMITINLD